MDKYLHLLCFIAHQVYYLQDVLTDTLIAVIRSSGITKKHKDNYYEQRQERLSRGQKIANKETLTLWVSNLATKDDKYHVHTGPNKYIKHSHEHNIIDKPKKTRRFAVQCTCEIRHEK
ncbi:MAG: hypothetical protein ACI94Y_001128 [Maribacter sp.]|jgi:hypothetical protein